MCGVSEPSEVVGSHQASRTRSAEEAYTCGVWVTPAASQRLLHKEDTLGWDMLGVQGLWVRH